MWFCNKIKQLITLIIRNTLNMGNKEQNYMERYKINRNNRVANKFKLPIPARLTDYLGEAMSEPI